MALYYDITKVKAIQDLDKIEKLIEKLSSNLEKIKVFVEEKNYEKTSKIIEKIIPITETLGIDSGYDEALQIRLWSEAQGKRKEIKTTLKEMISHCKNAVKEIKKDF